MSRGQAESDTAEIDGTDLPGTVASDLPTTIRGEEDYFAILRTLTNHDRECSLSVLTRTLVEDDAWSPNSDAANPYRSTHLALVREHLPVLAEFGAVEYDEELGEVRLLTGGSS